jgi:glucosylceramidase
MGRIHRRLPDIPFHHTEQGPAIISTERTERWWCDRVFGAFNNGCRLFTAWNLCLDGDGQPLTGPHTCAGLLEVDPETGEFKESALYRVFRHVGPFVKRGARLLRVDGDRDGTVTVLFRNPDGSHALAIGCSGRAEGRQGPPRARIHVKFRDEWLAVPLPIDVWSITTVVFSAKQA